MRTRIELAPDTADLLRNAGLDDMNAVFACDAGRRLDKPGLADWRQRWRLELGSLGQTRVLFLKRFDAPPVSAQWARIRSGNVRSSTAGVEWANAEALREAGISAAPAVALGEEMHGVWEHRSFILLGEVAGESLEKWVPANWPPRRHSGESPETNRQGRTFLDGLARFVAGFHQAGFVHRDLYLCHIFIATNAEAPEAAIPRSPRFTLIDLQRVFRPRLRRRRWVVKDLGALAYSAPTTVVSKWDRLRFICRYARCCPRYGSARDLATRIDRRVRRLIRRHGLVE